MRNRLRYRLYASCIDNVVWFNMRELKRDTLSYKLDIPISHLIKALCKIVTK